MRDNRITEHGIVSDDSVFVGGKLKPHFSKMSIWAYSIGTSIGWGSLVVTCNTYLVQAGIMGTVLGLVLGMFVIFVITHNLQYADKAITTCYKRYLCLCKEGMRS